VIEVDRNRDPDPDVDLDRDLDPDRDPDLAGTRHSSTRQYGRSCAQPAATSGGGRVRIASA